MRYLNNFFSEKIKHEKYLTNYNIWKMKTQNKPELLSKEVTISDSFHLLPQCEEIKEYIEKKFKEDDVTQ